MAHIPAWRRSSRRWRQCNTACSTSAGSWRCRSIGPWTRRKWHAWKAASTAGTTSLGPLKNFILPGGSRLVAQAHVCRSLARSAERRCQALDQEETLEGVGLRYLNRLSDLLFVAARAIARRQGVAEILWEAAAKPD